MTSKMARFISLQLSIYLSLVVFKSLYSHCVSLSSRSSKFPKQNNRIRATLIRRFFAINVCFCCFVPLKKQLT